MSAPLTLGPDARVVFVPRQPVRFEIARPGAVEIAFLPIVGPVGPAGAPGAATVTGMASDDLSGHRLVRATDLGLLTVADWAVDADATADLWLTTGATAAGLQATATTYGRVDEPSWAWQPGPIYLGADGALTQTVPTSTAGARFVRQVATALGPHSLFLNTSPAITLA